MTPEQRENYIKVFGCVPESESEKYAADEAMSANADLLDRQRLAFSDRYQANPELMRFVTNKER